MRNISIYILINFFNELIIFVNAYDNRIYYANDVPFTKADFFAGLLLPKWYGITIFECGGGVIRPDWIVTAAHCVYGKDEDFYDELKIGHGSTEKSSLILYDIDYYVIHQSFRIINGRTSNADIALIHLKQKLPVELEVLPVINYERIPAGTSGIFYSFGGHEGWTNYGYWASHMKYAFIQTTVPDCSGPIYDDLCWTHTKGTEAYYGDSGSPIMFGKEGEDLFYKSIIGSVLGITYTKITADGKKVLINSGASMSYYYFWIKHIIYFDKEKPPSDKKVVYCCKQETLEQYCIKNVKNRDFAKVETFPINSQPSDAPEENTCNNQYN